MSAEYAKGSSNFKFSTSYDNSGLGCSGSICSNFGDIIGDAKVSVTVAKKAVVTVMFEMSGPVIVIVKCSATKMGLAITKSRNRL